MAYVNEYTCTFKDCNGTTHVVYIDQEGGSFQGTLTPVAPPLIFSMGAGRNDPYSPIRPTSLELSIAARDTSVFDRIFGAGIRAFRMRWSIGGSVKWYGYVLTDELEMPIDYGVMKIRANCGLSSLADIAWTPAVSGAQKLILLLNDAIQDTGHGLQTSVRCNWHAADPQTSTPTLSNAVSGNSLDRYETSIIGWGESVVPTVSFPPSGFVLSQIAGAFGCHVQQADGYWHVTQRETNYSSPTGDIFNTSGVDTATNYTYTARNLATIADVLYGGITSGTTGYSRAITKYSVGNLGDWLFADPSFEKWQSANTVLTYWDEVHEDGYDPGTAYVWVETDRWDVRNDIGQLLGYEISRGVKILAVSNNNTSDNAVAKAIDGVKQDAGIAVPPDASIVVKFKARVSRGDASGGDFKRPAYWALWLDGDGGTDYYYNGVSWTSGTLPTHTDGGVSESVTSSSKRAFYITPKDGWVEHTSTAYGTPDSGKLRLVLYNIVETYNSPGSPIQGIIYDEISVTVADNSDWSAGTLLYQKYDYTDGNRGTYDAGTYIIGDGPTVYHWWRGLRYGGSGQIGQGDRATDWKAGSYSAGEALSGKTLENLRAQNALASLYSPHLRQRMAFHLDAGQAQYWPVQPLDYDSNYYICDSLQVDVERQFYTGEWVQIETSLPALVDPHDVTWTVPVIYAPTEGVTETPSDGGRNPRDWPGGVPSKPRVWLDPVAFGTSGFQYDLNNVEANTTSITGGIFFNEYNYWNPVGDFRIGDSSQYVTYSSVDDEFTIGNALGDVLLVDSAGAYIKGNLTVDVGAIIIGGGYISLDQYGITISAVDAASEQIRTIEWVDGANVVAWVRGHSTSGQGILWMGAEAPAVTAGAYSTITINATYDTTDDVDIFMSAGEGVAAVWRASALDANYYTKITMTGGEIRFQWDDAQELWFGNASDPYLYSFPTTAGVSGQVMVRSGTDAIVWGDANAHTHDEADIFITGGSTNNLVTIDASDNIQDSGINTAAVVVTSGGQTIAGIKTFTGTPNFQDGIHLQEGTPTATAGRVSLYGDTEDLPKTYIGTTGPLGVPVTWLTQYTPVTATDPTSATTLIGAGVKGTKTLPANHLVQGSSFRVEAGGTFSDPATGSTTGLTFTISLGGVTLDTASSSFATATYTNRWWHLAANVVVASLSGSTANTRLQGVLRCQTGSSSYAVFPFTTSTTAAVTSITSTRDWGLAVSMAGVTGGDGATVVCSNLVIEQVY